MKWIRCKDCGMAIKVNDYDFMATCPICDAKVFVQNAEEVRSLSNLYNAHQYCDNHTDNSNVRNVNNNVNYNNVYKASNTKGQANVKGNPLAIAIFIFVFIIFFIIAVLGEL